MSRESILEILSPAASGPADVADLAPSVPSLEGKRLGIRRDSAWRSFEVFADELGQLARDRLGVSDVVMFDPEARIGTPEHESGRVEAFAKEVDAAVVGLGT